MTERANLPTKLLPHADQAKAHADTHLDRMVAALRYDLGAGYDATYLWWHMCDGLVRNNPGRLAVGLASALVKLARNPVATPTGQVESELTGKHRSRIEKNGVRRWTTTCQACNATFPTTTQADAMFLANYHWQANQ